MTGKIVSVDLRGFGEIRSPECFRRVRFKSHELVDLAFADALGADVDFDLVDSQNGERAVRVRRARGEWQP